MVLNQWQALGHLEPEYYNDRSRKTFEVRFLLVKDQITPQVTEQVTSEVTGEVQKFLKILHPPMSRSKSTALNLKGQANFRDRYLKPALELELVEMTVPDKPRSSNKNIILQIRAKNGLNRTRRKNDHDTFNGIKNGTKTAGGKSRGMSRSRNMRNICGI